MSAPTPEEFETWREIEVAWLSEALAGSIANLGYPVGCGVPPKPEHLTKAAGFLFDRYVEMYRMVHESAAHKAEELLDAIKRIDSINDHPGRFNSEINDLTQAAIRKAEGR